LHGPSPGSQVFKEGLWFEGLDVQPEKLKGASGAHDILLTTLDCLLQSDQRQDRENALNRELKAFAVCRP
jgi:hypothetical protein